MKEITLKQDQQKQLFERLLEVGVKGENARSIKEAVVVNPLPVEKLSKLTGLKEEGIYNLVKSL